MTKDLVSIIVPCYNVEQYIENCVESIRIQSYENIEILLIDDGSLDNSGIICDKLSKEDSRINVIHKTNAGVSAARNAGIDNAKGSYVCFVDGDDTIEKDYVEYLKDLLLKYNAQISVTTEMYTSFNKKQIKSEKDKGVTGKQAAREMLYYHYPIGCYCKMFKREFLMQEKIRFLDDVFIGEGFNFNVFALCKSTTVAVGNRKVYTYRLTNDNSAMTRFNVNKCLMALKAIDIIREKLPIKTTELLRACDFADWHTHEDMYIWMLKTHVKNKYPQLYKQCCQIAKKGALNAVLSPIKKVERIRALLTLVHPAFLYAILNIRKFLNKILS